MPGKDGVLRVVKVRTKDGEYVRPVAKLYKLEENVYADSNGRGVDAEKLDDGNGG